MKKLLLLSTILLGLLFTFSACEKDKEKEDDIIVIDEPDDTIPTGSIRLKIDNGFEDELLSTAQEYIVESGDTIKVSMIRYYISNVYLTNENGDTLKIENSYYLIDTDGKEIELTNIPTGTYKSLCFGFGVDSSANHDISRNEGDLDPNGSNGMIWTWSSGYKFLRLEGEFKGDTSQGTFKFHVGGDANYKEVHFGQMMSAMRTSSEAHSTMFSAVVSESKTTEIHLRTNIAEVFKTPNTIDLDVDRQAHGLSSKIADNYTENFFELHHVEVQ